MFLNQTMDKENVVHIYNYYEGDKTWQVDETKKGHFEWGNPFQILCYNFSFIIFNFRNKKLN